MIIEKSKWREREREREYLLQLQVEFPRRAELLELSRRTHDDHIFLSVV